MKLKPQSLLAVGTEYLMASWKNPDDNSDILSILRDNTKDGITNYTISHPQRGNWPKLPDPDDFHKSKYWAYHLTFQLMDDLNNPEIGLPGVCKQWKDQGGKVYVQ